MAIPDEPLVTRLRPSLGVRRPGESAARQAAEILSDQSMDAATAAAEARPWQAAASGERQVGWELHNLTSPPWYVFHDILIGTRGHNVDHLVIGPGGVFSVNTKNLTGKVWVATRVFMLNGYRTDYLPKAHAEGMRVSIHLGVEVRPVIAVICDEFTVKECPPDVDVVARQTLRRWLERLPQQLSTGRAFAIARRADNPATWTTS
jgi:hypothetical protein